MKKRKALSFLLAVLMVVGLLPAAVFSATAASSTKTNPGGSADRWFKSDLYYDTEDTVKEAPLTIEALVHLPSAPSSNYWKQGILLSAYDSEGRLSVQLGTRSGGRPQLIIRDVEGYTKYYNFSKDASVGDPWPWANSYTHIAVTIDTEGYVCYYEKGTLKARITYANGTLPTDLEWRIGGDRTEANEYFFRGGVDYVAMYDEVLTAEEIAANKTAKAWDASKSLIAAWDLSKQTSTNNALLDRSGNGHDLIYTNGSGMKIDTFGTYMFDQALTGMPETVEVWVFLPDAYDARGGTLFGNRGGTTTGKQYFAFEIQYTGNPSFYYTNTEGVRETYTFTGADVTTGAWSHVAFVHDAENGAAHCYLNGALIGTIEGATAYHPELLGELCQFGADRQSGLAQRFNGFVKELRVYSDQRSAEEIASDYAGDVDYEDECLVLHFDLTPETEDRSIRDLTGNGNNVTYTQDWWEYEDVTHAKDYAYSFAIVGDTQAVTYKDSNNGTNNIGALYDWIVNNVEDKKVQFVFGMGDITEKDTDAEWELAKAAITKMDGVVPYSLVYGQGHDTAAQFDAYFADHEGYTSQMSGFYESGSIVNTYQEFTVGSTDYLVFALDTGIPDDVIAWANGVIEAHPAHRVIITTHMYLKKDGSYLIAGDTNCASKYDPANNNGDEIWEKLASKHPNVCMVMCGHKGATEVVVSENTGDYGNRVTQLLVNPQGMDGSALTGMVAMLYFSEDGEDVTVEYYSTLMDRYKPTKTVEVSYGSTVAPAYDDDLPERYVVAQNTENGRYTVIENNYFRFLGGSLRYSDATAESANIRFGYQFSMSVDLDAVTWSWNYGVAGSGLPSYVAGANKGANNVTNLVITGVPLSYFDSMLESQLVFEIEIDGTVYTVTDRVRSRSVLGVAQSIVQSTNEGAASKAYAQSVIDACAA